MKENNLDKVLYMEGRETSIVFQIRDPDIMVELTGGIMELFGMPYHHTFRFAQPGIYTIPIPKAVRVGPSMVNIYMNIIEPLIVGDTMAPLLKTVAVTSGEPVLSLAFSTRDYLPVNVQSFQVIEVEIRDITGAFAPFSPGTVFLRLHFRPQKRYK